jgi:radical SAM protein with 4Fe4S-binding SPASM domain
VGALPLGDMDRLLYRHIVDQYRGDIVQFNKDGEVLLYPHLYEAIYLVRDRIVNIVTNGILLWERRKDIEDVTTITVSVIEDDESQFETVKRFVEHYSIPVFIKFLGDYHNPDYAKLGLKTMRRTIHAPGGDWNYKKSPNIPELGICLDFLMKPSISWDGKFYICNRYDPEGKGVIGDASKNTIMEIWNNEKRMQWLEYHRYGQREKVPLCATCKFWGIPTG